MDQTITSPSEAKPTSLRGIVALVTITSEVDPEWIKFCDSSDVFGPNYCGLYLRGAAYDKDRGWLVWEHGGDKYAQYDKEPNRKRAIAAWIEGKPLPKDWHQLDKAVALKAWIEGVKWRGVLWFENGDGPAYGYAIQMALFGEERYA